MVAPHKLYSPENVAQAFQTATRETTFRNFLGIMIDGATELTDMDMLVNSEFIDALSAFVVARVPQKPEESHPPRRGPKSSAKPTAYLSDVNCALACRFIRRVAKLSPLKISDLAASNVKKACDIASADKTGEKFEYTIKTLCAVVENSVDKTDADYGPLLLTFIAATEDDDIRQRAVNAFDAYIQTKKEFIDCPLVQKTEYAIDALRQRPESTSTSRADKERALLNKMTEALLFMQETINDPDAPLARITYTLKRPPLAENSAR